MDAASVDWTEYADTFPERYTRFGRFDLKVADIVVQRASVLAVDVGGGRGTQALRRPHVRTWLLDPNVRPQDWMEGATSWDGILFFDLAVVRSCVNYLMPARIRMIPDLASRYIINTFECPPPTTWTERSYGSRRGAGIERYRHVPDRGVIEHVLLPDTGDPIRHEFSAYALDELVGWLPGVRVTRYGRNSVLLENWRDE